MPTDDKAGFAGQAVLMLRVALNEIATIEAEPDIAKVRIGIASVKSTLKELLVEACKEADLPPFVLDA